MKVRQRKGAFQITESSFDSPAFVVQHTQQRRRETGFGKVCDYSFVQIFFDQKSYNTERKRIQVVACIPDIIKLNLAGEPAVLLRLLADAVRQAFGERIAETRIKFRRIRQIETRKNTMLFLYADQVVPALLLDMRDVVVCLIAAIRNKNDWLCKLRSIDQFHKRPGFVLFPSILYDGVQKKLTFQIIQRVQVQQVIAASVLCAVEVGSLVMDNLIYVKNFVAAPESKFKNGENQNSGLLKIETQEFPKSKGSNTEKNNTDFNDTESLPFPSFRDGQKRESKRNDAERRVQYRELIMENISYDVLLLDLPYDKEIIEEILELIVDTVCTTKETVRISGDDKPAEVVRSRFLKLDSEHIRFVVSCMKENTTKIKNIRQYLLATLYKVGFHLVLQRCLLVNKTETNRCVSDSKKVGIP